MSISNQKLEVGNLVSLNSDKVLYERFEKDFTTACIKIRIIDESETNTRINSNSFDLHINLI